MRKEPYAGGDFYKYRNLVPVTTYVPKEIRAAYNRKAKELKKRKIKTSAQKLRAYVLAKNAPK